jgi:hypothetical protein
MGGDGWGRKLSKGGMCRGGGRCVCMYLCILHVVVRFWHPIYTALFCRENEVNERFNAIYPAAVSQYADFEPDPDWWHLDSNIDMHIHVRIHARLA